MRNWSSPLPWDEGDRSLGYRPSGINSITNRRVKSFMGKTSYPYVQIQNGRLRSVTIINGGCGYIDPTIISFPPRTPR